MDYPIIRVFHKLAESTTKRVLSAGRPIAPCIKVAKGQVVHMLFEESIEVLL